MAAANFNRDDLLGLKTAVSLKDFRRLRFRTFGLHEGSDLSAARVPHTDDPTDTVAASECSSTRYQGKTDLVRFARRISSIRPCRFLPNPMILIDDERMVWKDRKN
jgi:hypothetical protein